MIRSIVLIGVALTTVLIGGCATIDVPSTPNVNVGGGPPPPAVVVAADSSSPSDVQRENRELKARIAWLEDQIRRSSSKTRGQDKDIAELRAEIDKLAAERDRYRREAGR